MATLQLRGIYKQYDTGPLVINNISMDIKDGEFVVFVGPSGCGKSTMLRMIAGLEDIDEGELLIDGVRANDAFVRQAGHPRVDAAGQFGQHVAPIADFIGADRPIRVLAGAANEMDGGGEPRLALR